MKKISKKSAGLLVVAIALILVITLTGIRDLSSTYAMKDWEGITGIYIPEGTTAAPGEKVYVDLYADYNMWEYISISMKSTTSEDEFTVYLKNIHSNKAYFILPEPGNTQSSNPNGAKVGETYELRQINLFGYCNNQTDCSDKTASYTTYPVDGKVSINSFEKKYVTVKSPNTTPTTQTDKMTIESFKLLSNNVQVGDKVYMDLKYSSTKNIIGCFLLLENQQEDLLYYTIKDLNTKPYITIESTTSGKIPLPGETYNVTTMVCQSENDNQLINISSNKNFANAIHYNFDSKLTIKESTDGTITSNFNIPYFEMATTEVNPGDIVNLQMATNVNAISTILIFHNKEKNETLPVYLKGQEKMFFNVPTTVKSGTYELQKIIVKDYTHTYTITNDNGKAQLYEDQNITNNKLSIDLNKKIIVKEPIENKKVLILNNEDYTEEIKNKIIGLDEDAVITVYANNITLIDKGLFEAIRETRKTLIIEYGESEWIFSGTDIENPKSIDASMIISDITNKNFEGSFITSLPQKTKLLTFSDNGELPGKVLIRLKSIELDNQFGEDKLFIYYYDKDTDGLMKVAMEIQKDNGYYEFYINHNSKYILANKEIKGNFVSSDTDYLKLNTKSITKKEKGTDYSIYVILIGVVIGIILIIYKLIPRNEKKA